MSKRFAIDTSEPFRFETTLTMAICEKVDTPRSLTVYLMVKNAEWEQLLDLECDPVCYEDPRNFALDNLVTGLLKKSVNIPVRVDPFQRAITSFLDAELTCRRTNDRIAAGCVDLSSVKREVGRILGPLRKTDLNYVESKFRFGPGATTAVNGRFTLSDKYDAEMHLTEDLLPFYRAILGDRWADAQQSACIVEGSRFTTVPKTAKIDRGICIEPTLNIYYQLGVGALLRKRLLSTGIDLRTQDVNRRMAQRAYFDGLATIDLSAASDSISSLLVFNLLEPDWFHLLEIGRSQKCEVDGHLIELEKFSSMGNGYTFELETLLFLSICRSVIPQREHDRITVYGDDIIVPQRYAGTVVNTLETLGFKANRKKSFLAGNFFESCGADFFKGRNVRPFFLRQQKASKMSYQLQTANAIRLFCKRLGVIGCDDILRPIWKSLIQSLPSRIRKCRGPEALGDSVIICSLSEARPSITRMNDWLEGFSVLTLQLRPRMRRRETFGLLLSRLSNISGTEESEFTYGREPVRGLLGQPVLKRVRSVTWPNDGLDWISSG